MSEFFQWNVLDRKPQGMVLISFYSLLAFTIPGNSQNSLVKKFDRFLWCLSIVKELN